MSIPYKYITIEGNIGAGKTSLAKLIAEEYNARLILEEFEENSFLPKFYKEPERYAFPLELSFLAERWSQLKESINSRDLFHPFVISDYLVTKSLIFARKTLQEDEYKLYQKLFNIIHQSLPQPDLMVYLYASSPSLIRNIQSRGRAYEQEISTSYLESIQESYFDFINTQRHLRVLIINSENLDFVHSKDDYLWIKEQILKEYEIGIHRVSP